jgi:hypothetical protein
MNLIPALEAQLKKEIKLYREYIVVLAKERKELLARNHEKLIPLSSRRNEISRQMILCHRERIELIQEIFPSGSEKEKLSVLVESHCDSEAQAMLLPLVAELKKEVEQSQGDGREFSQVVNFALDMVNGVASIIWSATQNIVKSYSPKGELKETYHSRSRVAGVMKRA